MWRRLSDLRSHMVNMRDTSTYSGIAWEDLEVVVIEVRATTAAVLPLAMRRDSMYARAKHNLTITEPIGDKPTEGEE